MYDLEMCIYDIICVCMQFPAINKKYVNIKISYNIALFPSLQPSPTETLSCPHDMKWVIL